MLITFNGHIRNLTESSLKRSQIMIQNFTKLLAFWIVLLCILPKPCQACTTFCLDNNGRPVFGRNFDWILENGLIVVNKRGVTKKALGQEGKQLSWISKYGSVTFNQFGREFPLGGMNEAGLVIESMMLDETKYPLTDSRPEIGISQWIQYQLDIHDSIDDVIASDSQLRINGSKGSNLHFLICDKTGNCSTIEFIDGKLIYHTDAKMPVKVLTNNTYAESISSWEKGKIPEKDKTQSIERFFRSAEMVNSGVPGLNQNPINFAFSILKEAEQDTYKTQWSIVYDIADQVIFFRTGNHHAIRYFSFKSFDFSCHTPVKILDINADLSGDVTDKFINYNYQINRDLIRFVFLKTYFTHPTEDILDQISKYSDSTLCN